MESNEEVVQKQVVVHGPGERREVVTERLDRGPREWALAPGTMAVIAVLAIVGIAVVLYIVTNRNANESANRNANLNMANQAQAETLNQQPAPVQQAPVIIQQPAPVQQAPVIIQQPVAATDSASSASNDANMQEVATKRLGEETNMSGVSLTITDARAFLTGSVISSATKSKVEQIVMAVPGVKSVDNKIVVSGW